MNLYEKHIKPAPLARRVIRELAELHRDDWDGTVSKVDVIRSFRKMFDIDQLPAKQLVEAVLDGKALPQEDK